MKTVLFVCVGNSCRSQMAEAFFNKLSKNNRAISAGTNPAATVFPESVKAMKEAGIDISDKKPKPLTQEMVEKADRVITMGCEVEVCPAKHLPEIETWNIEDPYGKPPERFREIRNIIRAEVEKLVKEMEGAQ